MANFNSNPRGGLTVDRDSLHASDGYKRQIAAMELMKESDMAEKMDSERAPFESWVQTTSGWKACKQRGKPMHLRQNADGSYNDFRVNDRWCAWKARAHLAQPAQAVDVDYTLDDFTHNRDDEPPAQPSQGVDVGADKQNER